MLKIVGIKTLNVLKREAEMILKELQSPYSKLPENAINWTMIIVDFE